MADDLRARWFAATKTRYTTCLVPLIGEVRLRSLSAEEMRELRESFFDGKGDTTDRGRKRFWLLLAWCIVDDDGNRVFSDDDAMSGEFGNQDGAAFQVLVNKAAQHTNFLADPDWKAIEDAAKNSAATG